MPTLCVYVYVYVLIFEGVCKRHHAHITIERLPRQLLPRCLQCLLEYGRRRINTCPIFPQSPPIRIGPRTSTGSVAAGWHGLALLQLLPLVSNKHMISLSTELLLCCCITRLTAQTHGQRVTDILYFSSERLKLRRHASCYAACCST